MDLGFGYDVGIARARNSARRKMEDYIEEHPELGSLEKKALISAAEKAGGEEYEQRYNSGYMGR